ncbi:MAG: MG2 domain-containing protein, partial [Bacteroidota bacterium]
SLKAVYSQQVSFGKLRPSLKFEDKRSVYLTSAGNQTIEASIINVPEVELTITKVYENNILHFLGSSYYVSEYYDYDDYGYNDYYYGGGYNYYEANKMGDVVYESKINTSSLPLSGNHRLLKLDFEDKIDDRPGLYLIRLNARDPYYLNAQTVVCRSDIGLIAKSGKRDITVFANSIKTTKALPGVRVKLIGRNNQEVAQLTTDESGYASYQLPEDQADGFRVSLVTASQDDDFTYLPFSRTRVGTSRFEVEGRRENASGLEAFLYGERDIYRPGETINLAAVVRDYQWNVPRSGPLKLKLLSPDGRVFTSLRKTPDAQGALETDISVPVSAQTGRYTAQLWSASDVLLSSMGIMVEEFVPDRIKVDLSLDRDSYDMSQPIQVEAKAENFFGPPAAGRNYEVEMSLSRRYFRSEAHPEYNFHIPNLSNSCGALG